MSSSPKQRLTPAEFLDREQSASGRHEYFQSGVFAIASGSAAHNRIAGNIHGRLFQQLDGKPCQPNTGEVMVKVVTTGLYTYPDVSVACPPVEREAAAVEVLLNPKVLIEVLSPTTERHDRKTKLRHYQRIPSVAEILLFDQDEPLVEHFQRQPDGNWTIAIHEGLSLEISLPSISCRLSLSQVYAGVDFAPPAERSRTAPLDTASPSPTSSRPDGEA